MKSSSLDLKIGVVDYGVNNVGSVLNMLRRLELDVVAVRNPNELEQVSAIVLPGIGAYDAGVDSLARTGLADAIRSKVLEQRAPILGICLGMQLLAHGSEEGQKSGLGLVDATCKRLSSGDSNTTLRVPHMGWNDVETNDEELFDGLVEPRFYFVHSYHVICANSSASIARCNYGGPFTAALRQGQIVGVQFHPEKSHRFGMRLLSNWARLAERGLR